MTPAVELVDFATRYKLRTGKLPAAMPATMDEVRLIHSYGGRSFEGIPAVVPQFMGIDLYPCTDAMERRDSLR